ncbi:MAG: FadR family transcriptional regulator [Eubacterium sp.]|nr:FadR family transcriptional regulator [Eubacterium sp.]
MEKTQKTKPDKTYYQVIAYIMEMIKEGKLSFYSKLPSERELMETLGMGRNSVREALRTLENIGLVESCHGKGNFLVNHMGESLSSVFSVLLFTGESNYLEVSQLRRAIEVQAFAQAADRITEDDRNRFAGIILKMDTGTHEERVQADEDFHQLLIQCSGNHLLVLLMDALSYVCREEILMILENQAVEHVEQWKTLHRRIFDYLMIGDKEQGVDALLDHYRWGDSLLGEKSYSR